MRQFEILRENVC